VRSVKMRQRKLRRDVLIQVTVVRRIIPKAHSFAMSNSADVNLDVGMPNNERYTATFLGTHPTKKSMQLYVVFVRSRLEDLL
jgi:hypothetical protein